MRAIIYARFSTENQRESSIADQVRLCQRLAHREGWTVIAEYSDSAISGSVPVAKRPGSADLMKMVNPTPEFDILILEGLDRLSRDLVEQEIVVRKFEFKGIRVVGVADGYDSNAIGRQVMRGIRGVINQVYIDDLRQKTHRGLEGQARRGNNAGGKSYGYRHIPIEDCTRLDHLGRPTVIAVRRQIDPVQAQWILFIFEKYASGKSPCAIASELNEKSVPSPRGGSWASSAIYGSPGKTTGILRNTLYIGHYVWNRSEWVKNPETNKRIRRERNATEHIETELPELRIVPQPLWDRVQARIARQTKRSQAIKRALHDKARGGGATRYLFSGLLKCGVCGAPIVTVGNARYGCSWHKYRGPAVCGNKLTVSRLLVEKKLLDQIRQGLCHADALELFISETRRLLQDKKIQATPSVEHVGAEIADVQRTIDNLVMAIASGTFSPALRAALEQAEWRRSELEKQLAETNALCEIGIPDFLPRAAEHYKEIVESLDIALKENIDEARECIRGLVGDEIVVRPAKDSTYLEAVVTAGYLKQVSGLTLAMVAGARSGCYLTPMRWRLWPP